MIIKHNNINYELLCWSDVVRDDVYLELNKAHTNPFVQIAEVFYSDVTDEFTLSCFVENIPLDLIEQLIAKAKETLPPIDKSE